MAAAANFVLYGILLRSPWWLVNVKDGFGGVSGDGVGLDRSGVIGVLL